MYCIFFLLSFVSCSIYLVNGKAHGWEATEKMFATNKGPFGWNGPSFVQINGTGRVVAPLRGIGTEYAIVVAVYYEEKDISITFDNLCDPTLYQDTTNKKRLKGAFFPMDNSTTLTYGFMYPVDVVGNQRAIVQSCSRTTIVVNGTSTSTPYTEYSSGVPFAEMNATLAFKNPYGYLPALMYGLLPFSGGLAVMYAVIDLFFLFVFCRHWKTILNLQYFILVVLFLNTCM